MSLIPWRWWLLQLRRLWCGWRTGHQPREPWKELNQAYELKQLFTVYTQCQRCGTGFYVQVAHSPTAEITDADRQGMIQAVMASK